MTNDITNVTPDEARAIARDAYIYGFPMVDGYRIQYEYFVDKANNQYKGEWNTLINTARVYTPDDTSVQTPNSDTPYSFAGLDLRAEPMVLTIPPIEAERYYSVQLVDSYTFNFNYIGTRTTGNNGGRFLLTGPGWMGEKPDGIDKVIQSETFFNLAIIRTQLFNPEDIDNVKKVQSGYKLQTLSEFLGKQFTGSVPKIDFIQPLAPKEEKTNPSFFDILNFVLSFCPADPSETELMERFAKLRIGGGMNFQIDTNSEEIQEAIKQGMTDAFGAFNDFKKSKIDTGILTAGDMFGTREFLKNDYMKRMAAALIGIFGNSKEEAMYPLYTVDSDGSALNGSNKYVLRFEKGMLPPVNAFWSLTMYELPSSLLHANKLNRYLINSPMVPQLKTDNDGGITLYIQNESPGADMESNWLPSPDGSFFCVLRLYYPKTEALDGSWKVPKMKKSV